eukprot:g42671.t1
MPAASEFGRATAEAVAAVETLRPFSRIEERAEVITSQTYIKSQDKDFVAATIQAIGRCATNIDEVRDTCLNGLVQLLSNRDELVVAESVVVIKKLLQMQPSQHSDIIRHMAKLIDNIMVSVVV